MKKMLRILMCLFPTVSMAKDITNDCDFTIQSKIHQQHFSFLFHSPSKDCTNDDQEIWLQFDEKRTKLQLPPAWYYDINHVGNQPSQSKSGYPEYPLFFVSGSEVLIILRADNRPHHDKVIAATIDLYKTKVLNYQVLGESHKQSTGILVEGGKYRIQLIKEYLDDMRCDCDAAFVEGWMGFQIVDGKINKHWL